MRWYLDIDGLATDEFESRAPHATHHFKVVGSVGHLDRAGIGHDRVLADHQRCVKGRVPQTTRFREMPAKTMVRESKKCHGLLVDNFEAIMPDIRNARFRIFADDDTSGNVRSTVIR